MIDLTSINRSTFSSDDEYYQEKIMIVNLNWKEIQTKLENENPTIHYQRFINYQNTIEFTTYIEQMRDGESSKDFGKRMNILRDVERELKYGSMNYVLETFVTQNQNESLMQHYYRFIDYESRPGAVNDICNPRAGENDNDFRLRFIDYCEAKENIIGVVEDEIFDNMERLDEDESLEDWKVRAEQHFKNNQDFLSTIRKVTRENLRDETQIEIHNRLDHFKNFIVEIDKTIVNQEFEEKINNSRFKEKEKLKARRDDAEDERLEIEKKENEDYDDHIEFEKSKIFVIMMIIFSVIGFFVIWDKYGLERSISLSILSSVIFCVVCFYPTKTGCFTIFKFFANIMFWGFTILNVILQSIGVVENKRR